MFTARGKQSWHQFILVLNFVQIGDTKAGSIDAFDTARDLCAHSLLSLCSSGHYRCVIK